MPSVALIKKGEKPKPKTLFMISKSNLKYSFLIWIVVFFPNKNFITQTHETN